MNRREFIALGVVGVGGQAFAHAPEKTGSGWQLRVEEGLSKAAPNVTLSLPTVKVIRRGAAKGRVNVEVCNATSMALRVRSASWSRDLMLEPGVQERCSMDDAAGAIVHVSAQGAVTRSLINECGAPIGDADVSYVLPIEQWGSSAGGPDYLTLGGAFAPSAHPLQVRFGQRMHLRLFNGAGTRAVSVALPEHRFEVHAIDGEELERPVEVAHLSLSPAQFLDVVVPMNRPGRWILGSLSREDQKNGFGRLVEYTGSQERIVACHPMRAYQRTAPFCDGIKAELPRQPTRELIYAGAATDRHLSVHPGVRHRLILSNLYGHHQTLALRLQAVKICQVDAQDVRGVERSTVSLPPYSRTVVEFTPRLPHVEIMAL